MIQPRHITWRGPLQSCNYACSYCPFAKRAATAAQLAADEKAMITLTEDLASSEFAGSVLLAPFGEGMIHPHYRRGYATLSRLPGVKMISCQTNLSFDPEQFLAEMREQGAVIEKLALWATFHPGMTAPQDFLARCHNLAGDIRLSVGMVGDPAQLALMEKLAAELPPGATFWINAMDGLGRRYTSDEVAAFTRLDPLFPLETKRFAPDGCCHGEFISAAGSFPCNRSKQPRDTWAEGCGGRCDCFLAYSNRKDIPRLLSFGPYPQLRLKSMPPKALFFDLDGTVRQGPGHISPGVRLKLRQLAATVPLYCITSRPRENALELLDSLRYQLSGGVFSLGAHTVDFAEGKEQVIPLPTLLPGGRRVSYSRDGTAVKQILQQMPQPVPEGCRIAREGVLSMVAEQAAKEVGVATICRSNGWEREDVLVYGNSAEDVAVLSDYPWSAAPPDATGEALGAARYHLEPEQLLDVLIDMK